MAKGKISIWLPILQFALAAMLIVGGCNVFFGNLWTKLTSSDELIVAVSSLFDGDLRKIVVYTLAVIEIITGVLLILDFFKLKSVDKLDNIFLLIIMVLWLIVFVVLGDILPFVKGKLDFIPFLSKLSKDLVILCAFGMVKAKV
jgi:hypothetical protein